jgi:hypothetical protein
MDMRGETEQKHRELNINKDEWKKERVEILKLINYLKKLVLITEY